MTDYQDLIKKLAQINEGASIVTLDVTASSNEEQQLKTVLIGLTLSSGATASMTVQSPDFETLLDSLETIFSVQGQIIEQAIDQVNVLASTDQYGEMDGGMGGEMAPMGIAPAGDEDIGFALGGDDSDIEGDDTIPAFGDDGEPNGIDYGAEGEPAEGDVVVDTDELAPETGDDVETEEGRYSHNYSFRQKGTGLFQSLTGQQRISKGALKAAKRRLGN